MSLGSLQIFQTKGACKYIQLKCPCASQRSGAASDMRQILYIIHPKLLESVESPALKVSRRGLSQGGRMLYTLVKNGLPNS
jgi:hypothetical protein